MAASKETMMAARMDAFIEGCVSKSDRRVTEDVSACMLVSEIDNETPDSRRV